jgi:broad specificity phosphatase PhoE
VRHGQSAGNVARDAAEAGGLTMIDLAWRDIDVPLSELGVAQSVALGDWFAKLPADEQPEVILCSTYLRARETARLVAESSRLSDSVARLRVDWGGVQVHQPQRASSPPWWWTRLWKRRCTSLQTVARRAVALSTAAIAARIRLHAGRRPLPFAPGQSDHSSTY